MYWRRLFNQVLHSLLFALVVGLPQLAFEREGFDWRPTVVSMGLAFVVRLASYRNVSIK